MHSSILFIKEHPELSEKWYTCSQAITLLAVPNEDQLKFLVRQLSEAGIKHSIFIEPDIDNQITAIAIQPSEAACKLCSSFPLALKQYNKPQLINKHSSNGKEVAA